MHFQDFSHCSYLYNNFLRPLPSSLLPNCLSKCSFSILLEQPIINAKLSCFSITPDPFNTQQFQISFERTYFNWKEFLPWMFQGICEPATNFSNNCRKKEKHHQHWEKNHLTITSLIQTSELLVLKIWGTQLPEFRVHQSHIPRCCWMVCKKHMKGFINGATYIQIALDSKVGRSSLSRALFQCTQFEVQILFHSFMFVQGCIAERLFILPCNYITWWVLLQPCSLFWWLGVLV